MKPSEVKLGMQVQFGRRMMLMKSVVWCASTLGVRSVINDQHMLYNVLYHRDLCADDPNDDKSPGLLQSKSFASRGIK